MTIVGLTSSNLTLANLSMGSILNTNSQASSFSINPASISNTRINQVNIGSNFVFGASSQIGSVAIQSNNSSTNVNVNNTTFHFSCTINTPNASISNCLFKKDLSFTKEAGAQSASTTYLGKNTYYGNVTLTTINIADKNLVIGDDANASDFYGTLMTLTQNYQSAIKITVKNFVFHNAITVSQGGPSNLVNSTFQEDVLFSGSYFNIISPTFDGLKATFSITNNASISNPLFIGNVIIDNISINARPYNVTVSGVRTESTGTLDLIGGYGSIIINNSTINSALAISTTGAINAGYPGNITFNSCILSSTVATSGTGNAAIAFNSCTFNEDITVSKTGGTGYVLIGNPVFASGKKMVQGNSGFTDGCLVLTGNWTSLQYPINLSFTGTAGLQLNNMTCGQNIKAVATRVLVNGGGVYDGDVDLTSTNNAASNGFNMWGPATFNAKFKLELSTGYINLAGAGNMDFKGDFDANSLLVTGGQNNTILVGSTNYACNFYSNVNIDYGYTGACNCNYTYKLFNVKFLGSSPQRLSSSRRTNTQLDIFRFEINKPDKDLTIDQSSFLYFMNNATAFGTINMVKGRIINNMAGTKPLALISTNVSGAGPNSYIVGKVAKQRIGTIFTPESFTFPVGSMNRYAPITITRNDQSGGLIGLEYFEGVPVNASSFGTAKDVSKCEYWKFNNYSASGAVMSSLWYDVSVTITLPWNSSNNCTPISPNVVGIAAYNGTVWNLGTSVVSSGSTVPQGSVVGSQAYTSVMLNNMLVTYGFSCPSGQTNITQTLATSLGSGNVCPNQAVIFTASSNIAELFPTIKWKVNDNEVQSSTSNTYTSSSLANGDVVTASATTTSTCVSNPSVTSNAVTVQYSTTGEQTATITNKPQYCATELPVELTSDILGGTFSGGGVTGNSLGSVPVGTHTVSYTYQTGVCNLSKTVSKDLTIVDYISPTASVSISPAILCTGQPLVLSAVTNLAGLSPSYQWYLNNGAITGATSSTYSSASLSDGDKVKVQVSTTSSCASQPSVTSSNQSLDIQRLKVPEISIYTGSNLPVTNASVDFLALVPSGTQANTVTWYKNGQQSGTGTSYTATLQDQDMVMATLSVGENGDCIKGGVYNSNILMNAEQGVYYDLKPALEGNYENVKGRKLYFRYREKYVNGSVLKYEIRDKTNSLVTGVPVPQKTLGDNYYMLDLSGAGGLSAGGYYVLEVVDEKNHRGYLRFKTLD